MKNQLLSIGVALVIASCNNAGKEGTSTTVTDSSAIVKDSVKAPVATVEQVWATDTTLRTPESVLFDAERKILYVANINGMPTDKDKNGFISKVTIDGKIDKLEWVKGFDAPKGMGIYKNKLYVTDISKVVEIDIEKGKIVKTYNVPDAKFLNDITVDSAGVVYISDSETNKIHTLTNGKVAVWLDKDLNKPNGLLVEKDRILVTSMGSADFKAIDLKTKTATGIATEIGAGDGLIYFGKPGHFIVSDWNGTVFLVEPNGTKTTLIDSKADKINSADIGFIQDGNILLVPTFFKNSVVAYKVTHNDAD
jgi:sugar lactone lactonase YvrE